MSYSQYTWDTLADDYNPLLIKYCGEDMQDAYDEGCQWYEFNSNLEKENEALRQLIAANVRVIKAEIIKELAEENKDQGKE